jgi:hypothetical protein
MSVDNDNSAEEVAVLGETKAERFKRVINARLRKMLAASDQIKSMMSGANANSYEWTPEQAERLAVVLQQDVDTLIALARKQPVAEADLI